MAAAAATASLAPAEAAGPRRAARVAPRAKCVVSRAAPNAARASRVGLKIMVSQESNGDETAANFLPEPPGTPRALLEYQRQGLIPVSENVQMMLPTGGIQVVNNVSIPVNEPHTVTRFATGIDPRQVTVLIDETGTIWTRQATAGAMVARQIELQQNGATFLPMNADDAKDLYCMGRPTV